MTWEEYEKKLKELGYSEKELVEIKPAFLFATEAHKNEKRKSGESYITHPIAVSIYVAKRKLDTAAISAALLHDVVENQGIKIETLKKQFGDEVAFLVEAVTKVDRVHYRGMERAVESLRKMFLAVAQDIRVVIIKLMDRLHNMETLEFHEEEKRKRIAEETLELYAPLADRLGMWEIKAKLEDLAFPVLCQEEYQMLTGKLEEKKEEKDKYLEKLKPVVELELKKEGVVPLKILYRTKHLYSIWKKLVKYEMDFDRVLDLVAMRIIVGSVEDCYRSLGILHKLWKPMPGRIKDFIALPKPNGYRSLHTTVFGPAAAGKPDKKIVVDFQIRTEEMDREAEYGISAHWVYEAGGKRKSTPKMDKNLSWVSELSEWYRDQKNASHEELMAALKIDFFKDRIFALTPKGEVIDLPEGATPVDFAYRIHSEIGDHMFGAKANGKMVPFSYKLKSGSTVEILTQKNKKPSADWLDFAKTSLAKNRIRSYLRRSGISENAQNEHQIFEATITSRDRVGLLKDFSEVFAKLKINISDVKFDSKNKNYLKIIFTFPPKKGLPNSKILTALRSVKNVETISIKEIK